MKKFLCLLFFSCFAQASVFDLTTTGSSAELNNAYFLQTSVNPAGTGTLEAFVRIQNSPTESGYNTSYRPVEFDEKTSRVFNHDLQLSDLAIITINSQEYIVFELDINERANEAYLSLDSLQIFVSQTGNRSSYPDLGTLIFDLDANENNSIVLNASLNAGSGQSDMRFLIPASLLQEYSLTNYIYVYSSFGEIYSSSDGVEEWGVSPELPRYTIPETNTFTDMLLAMSFVFLYPWRLARKTNNARALSNR